MHGVDMNTSDVQHPYRQLAIRILESIADKLGKSNMFDCKGGDSKWYDFEDMLVELIVEFEKEKQGAKTW